MKLILAIVSLLLIVSCSSQGKPPVKTGEGTKPRDPSSADTGKTPPEPKEIETETIDEVVLDLPQTWSVAAYSNLTLGEPLPEIYLPDTEGAIRSMAEFRGKKVLLINFASW